MKPAWDKLGSEFKESDTVLIADVDCTVYRSICDKYGVKGFPTIKYFNAGSAADGDSYDGGRDYDSLKKFADGLKPVCSPNNLDLCEDDDRKKIEELMAMDADALDAAIEEKEQQIKDAEKTFEDELEKLQNKYKEISEAKDNTISEVKASGLGLMKAVKASSGSKSEL